MGRRDFLERFSLALAAVLFALFGIRPDVTSEAVEGVVKATARALDPSAYANILKELYPQAKVYAVMYGGYGSPCSKMRA